MGRQEPSPTSRPDAMIPRWPRPLGARAPGCIATSRIKRLDRPWCPRTRGSSDQVRRDTEAPGPTSCRRQLGAPISSTALVPYLDGSFVDLGADVALTPTWRRWHDAQVIVLSRYSMHLVPWETLAPSHCISSRCQGAIPILWTLVPQPAWSARHPGGDGSERPGHPGGSAGLIHRGTSHRGPWRCLAPW